MTPSLTDFPASRNAPPPRPDRRSRPGRWILRVLACAAVFSLSGCVFLRLLELKNQLADFDRNFSVAREDGLSITALHPVLLESDLRLLGLPPTIRTTVDAGITWTLVFEKQYPEIPGEDPDFDLSVALRFTDGKLARVHLGEEYFALIPKDAFLMTIKSLGQIKVNTLGREAVLDIEDSTGPEWDFTAPRKPDILATLGAPYRQETHDEGSILDYRYRLRPPEAPPELAEPTDPGVEYLLRIVFSKTEHIRNVSGTLPLVGRINVNYE